MKAKNLDLFLNKAWAVRKGPREHTDIIVDSENRNAFVASAKKLSKRALDKKFAPSGKISQ